jgi:hypothetical protein
LRDERSDVLGTREVESEGLDLEPLLLTQARGRGLAQRAIAAGQDDPITAPSKLAAGLEPHAAIAAGDDGDPLLLGHAGLHPVIAQPACRPIRANT